MRLGYLVAVLAIVHPVLAQSGLVAPHATVGRNLQTPVAVRLPDLKARQSVKLTIASDDPSRLLLSDAPDKAGSASITVTCLSQFRESPMFWLQGLADSGSVGYTVSAEQVGSAKATVTLTASAIVIIGPFRAPKFPMTPRADPAKITAISAALNSEGKVGAEQQLAGGSKLEVEISNSNPNVGRLRASKLVLVGGSSYEATLFEPAAEGETTLTPVQPPGFRVAREYASVVAAIAKPGLAIDGEMFLGKDLQVGATLLLGEAAPPSGIEVTLASADPSKLVLALQPDAPGSASIKIAVPAGQVTAAYFIHALGDSGIVTYEAKAPGYRSRVARVGLAKSGVIVAYDPYGPPDEAAVLRKSELHEDRAFYISLGNPKEQNNKLVVWTAYLDRETERAADITVQPLRPGVKLTVNLTSSKPEVGAVQSPLTIESGKNHAISRFTAVSKGVTVISVDTPAGFSTPKNATSVPAHVND
jgi:hypothetical protein